MSEVCIQSCSTCSDDHSKTEDKKPDFSVKHHELSTIKKVIGVVSGKGGVGKSLVTSILAVEMKRRGYHTAVLDADITGPSIPKAFGIKGRAEANELGLFPMKSKTGIDIMSINLLLENDTDPVVWRGPIIAGTVKQFWSDVIWGDVDFMFVDMPLGTGDVPLTVFQSIPVDGIIVVTSPQELVSMIVSKAVKMARMMNIPIIGIVVNMAYYKCPDCSKEHKIFGESHIEEIAEKHNINIISKLPVDAKISSACDKGAVEFLDMKGLENIVEILEHMEVKKMKIAVASEKENVTEHFGHCESFTIFHVENNQINKSEVIPNPGHKPDFLPNFLNDMGVNAIISGGMGAGAIEIFNEKGIKVITGASGKARTAVEQYLEGKLISTNSVCHQHQHADECGH
jgi:Mrp family chromosome partitioning ATPase/predicted Fe-Mo cluster-binding NifX family protein